MKLFKKIITSLLLIVLGALSTFLVYMFAGESKALEIYVEEMIIPNAVLGLSTAGLILAAAYGIIKRLDISLLDFGRATDKVTLTAEDGKALAKSVEETKDAMVFELSTAKAEIRESTKEITVLKDQILKEEKVIEYGEQTIKKMLLVALCNNDELVSKGYAKVIAEIAKGEKEDEEQ